jgi:hypothetical protein
VVNIYISPEAEELIQGVIAKFKSNDGISIGRSQAIVYMANYAKECERSFGIDGSGSNMDNAVVNDLVSKIEEHVFKI